MKNKELWKQLPPTCSKEEINCEKEKCVNYGHVYVVQMMERDDVYKVGQAVDLRVRLQKYSGLMTLKQFQISSLVLHLSLM